MIDGREKLDEAESVKTSSIHVEGGQCSYLKYDRIVMEQVLFFEDDQAYSIQMTSCTNVIVEKQ